MDKGALNCLTITRLREGGYVVKLGALKDDFSDLLGAFTSVDEALAYIKHAIEPVRPQEPDMKYALYGNRDKGFGGTVPASLDER